MPGYQYDILSEHLRGARFLFAPGGTDSDHWIETDLTNNGSQQVLAELGEIGQQLAAIPHDETGLNIPRITSFFERCGLASKSFVGIDKAGQQAINKIMGWDAEPTTTVASHFPLLGFTYVVRNQGEQAEEAATREASVVHETSHANQPHWDILTFKRAKAGGGIGYMLIRNGFTSHVGRYRGGNYFEEGFASLMSHTYITEELGFRNGLLGITQPHRLELESSDDMYLLPGSYLYPGSEKGWVNWPPSAHAAYGMRLLIAKDRSIFPAMIAARNDADGLREVVRRVEALGDGLYDDLRRQPYEEMRFRSATHYIIDRLYDGDQQAALAVTSEQDSRDLAA